MKSTKIKQALAIGFFALLLSTSAYAQDAPKSEAKDSNKKECCSTDKKATKHVCSDACKTLGCDAVKAKEAKACTDKAAKHVCADECKTNGCTAAVKVSYECPMKCEPASDNPGECSKCGMELKKVSKKS